MLILVNKVDACLKNYKTDIDSFLKINMDKFGHIFSDINIYDDDGYTSNKIVSIKSPTVILDH